MKKLWVLVLFVCCLTGCGQAEVFETVDDAVVSPALAQPGEISLNLPEDTILPVMETDEGTLYMCRDFDVTVQTVESGNLSGTIQDLTGRSMSDMTVIQTTAGELDCWEFVWTATAEGGDQVCRAKILDDGNYQYILTAMTDADLVSEYQEIWNGIFESFDVS